MFLTGEREGLTRVQEVLKLNGPDPPQITVRKMEMVDNDFVVMLKELKKHGEYRFIVDCDTKTIQVFLKAALKLKMISNLFHYFFTSLDLGLVDLSEFKYGKGNITAFRLIDPDRKEVIDKRSEWQLRENEKLPTPLNGDREIATETALAYDAFSLFALALDEFTNGGENQMDVAQLSCDKVKSWKHGSTLRNYMLVTKFDGLSGPIKFVDGERYDFNLDLMYLTEDGLIKGGRWDRTNGLNMTLERAVPIDTSPQDNHYIVSTYLAQPYVIKNASHPTGYWGFCVELLDYIAKAKNFTYEIRVETTVGKKQANGTWTGVMGALIDRRAQIGIGDLTINLDREKHVDFTKPFLTLGITILYRKPAPKSLNLFSFLKPLSVDVWVYMIAAYLCVSFMLFVIARFSPYEWCNPHPCNPDTDEVENQFTVMNSLWFTIGSLMQQGCEIAPRALSTRMVKEGGVAGKAAELGVENVGGVFVVLMGGVIVGFFVSVCEFVWKARKNARKDKQTLCSEMSEEFRFAVRCLGPKTSNNDPPDEVTDNGLQFMPLTGYPHPPQHGKEVYA
ncbi:glutamate receptor, ionotropic kainate [Elysia marginata]|uniref:Glutamate receptor, ionotropic kainate n=1 Tax=Elysia marginata TaxID=1093978 RepID=A0AAV4GL58_9GAST|nr:glutamate receptor, ionotropic kainate [Elysia marginata]